MLHHIILQFFMKNEMIDKAGWCLSYKTVLFQLYYVIIFSEIAIIPSCFQFSLDITAHSERLYKHTVVIILDAVNFALTKMIPNDNKSLAKIDLAPRRMLFVYLRLTFWELWAVRVLGLTCTHQFIILPRVSRILHDHNSLCIIEVRRFIYVFLLFNPSVVEYVVLSIVL